MTVPRCATMTTDASFSLGAPPTRPKGELAGQRRLHARRRRRRGGCPTHHSGPVRSPCPHCRCGVPAANATFSSTAAAGSCITSQDDVRNRTAVFVAFGKAVTFWSGMYDPQNPAEPSGGASMRALLQAGTGGVWANYSYFEVSGLSAGTAR